MRNAKRKITALHMQHHSEGCKQKSRSIGVEISEITYRWEVQPKKMLVIRYSTASSNVTPFVLCIYKS